MFQVQIIILNHEASQQNIILLCLPWLPCLHLAKKYYQQAMKLVKNRPIIFQLLQLDSIKNKDNKVKFHEELPQVKLPKRAFKNHLERVLKLLIFLKNKV